MAMIPKTVGELRKYLETYPDETEIHIVYDDDSPRMNDWYDMYVGFSKGDKDALLFFAMSKEGVSEPS